MVQKKRFDWESAFGDPEYVLGMDTLSNIHT